MELNHNLIKKHPYREGVEVTAMNQIWVVPPMGLLPGPWTSDSLFLYCKSLPELYKVLFVPL